MTNETPEGTRARARPYWFILALAILVILADQASKWWAEAALGDGAVIELPGGFFRFVLVYNPGAAFGLGSGFTWVLAVLAGGTAIAIAWYAWRVRSWLWAIAAGLVLGGAVTHFGDRAFRGEVVDFIAYGDFFVGNVADIAIVGGAIFAALLSLLQVPLAGRARGEGTATPEG